MVAFLVIGAEWRLQDSHLRAKPSETRIRNLALQKHINEMQREVQYSSGGRQSELGNDRGAGERRGRWGTTGLGGQLGWWAARRGPHASSAQC